MKKLLVVVLLIITLFSCKKEKSVEKIKNPEIGIRIDITYLDGNTESSSTIF